MLRELDEAARALVAPHVVLFDWHATLVDTLDAMYQAVDDALPRFPELGLLEALISHDQCRTPEDARLVDYVREHRQLHPKIKAQRRISRTDIFEILFGSNEEAKRKAHQAFNDAYRNHYGEAHPFEGSELDLLIEMREFDVRLGVLTNRDREFFELELALVDDGEWVDLFDVTVCGCDTGARKPNPDPIFKALELLGEAPGTDCWYVGDSTTDVAAAKRAGITSVFFNGVGWDHAWINKIFPGTAAHPHQPDAIVDSFAEFKWLVEECLHVGHDWKRSDPHPVETET
jgi:phosphoglycolate phosphatase